MKIGFDITTRSELIPIARCSLFVLQEQSIVQTNNGKLIKHYRDDSDRIIGQLEEIAKDREHLSTIAQEQSEQLRALQSYLVSWDKTKFALIPTNLQQIEQKIAKRLCFLTLASVIGFSGLGWSLTWKSSCPLRPQARQQAQSIELNLPSRSR
ncbi:MAG: hypothetical protein KME17_08545 [Cyanosarcina radialis HA8281-LM2]|nr:hypothetical protein [Cyanosarcina radialis HA8281-LM2]